jgi:glycosyl transferase family 1
MPRVAFFAPLKPPNHPTPSGDREMARNLMSVIGANGAQVDLVSDMRIYDKAGDPTAQATLRKTAALEVERLVETLPNCNLWVTYHNYYKAPDLIGPAVCRARNIPYVQIESTRASSRLSGPWAKFATCAHDACDAASIIFYLTANDLITLERDRTVDQQLVHFPPFLPRATLPEASSLAGPMLSVGMMRSGDKLNSYRIIAETLAQLSGDWRLNIVGDGPARPDVKALMAPFGDRVQMLGLLDRQALASVYGKASLFLWPGVNEAFGMVYLEAQAAGLPVVAQDRPGVRDILAGQIHPSPQQGPAALARNLGLLLSDPELRKSRSAEARAHVAQFHLAPAATTGFWAAVSPLLKDRT